MGSPSSTSLIEERLALHELIRIGFGRGEDLQLLQVVGQTNVAACYLSLTAILQQLV